MTQPPPNEAAPAADGPSRSPRRRLGCWGAGAITCGSLFLIFAVFLGTVFWLVRPYLSQIWATSRQSLRCAQNLTAIHGALDRYRHGSGAYPKRLIDLRPRYLSRVEIFRCPADRGAGPISYRYTPPAPAPVNSPPTPIVTCNHHVLVVKGQTAVSTLELMPDGKIRQKTVILQGVGNDPAERQGAGSEGSGG